MTLVEDPTKMMCRVYSKSNINPRANATEVGMTLRLK
jgi:hypothetical protein